MPTSILGMRGWEMRKRKMGRKECGNGRDRGLEMREEWEID